MEQPRRPYQFGMPESLEGDAGAVAKHPEVPHVAGQIVLQGEAPGTKEDQQIDHVERSAWHRIGLNRMGHVVEQAYGQEFYKEQATEHGGMPPQDLPQPGQVPQQSDPLAQPQAAPIAPVPQAPQTQFTASNPIYATMAHPMPAQQPQPIDQPASGTQTTLSGVPQPYAPTPSLTGAVNPSFAQLSPQLPQMQEQMLSEGSPAPVDPQHLLPATSRRATDIFKSPWLWLAIGVGMVLYFGRSLFS
jgi:hypothetical protein